MEMTEFKFPDEKGQESEAKAAEDSFEIEVEDDTPEEDRDRKPLPQNLKEELENDELDQYDDKIKTKLKQMRKVYHDERREKERIARENTEAVSMLQRLMEENKKYRELIQTGSKEYASNLETTASLELDAAKRKYKEAYDAGDADALAEAAQALSEANFKAQQAKNFKPPALQEENYQVQRPQNQVQSDVDPKLNAWRERNPWYGQDDEMTAAAIGLHRKIEREGNIVIGSDRYYAELDKTIRKRFPEHFEVAEESDDVDEQEVVKKAKTESAQTKPSTVVAPAVRSTTSKKIRLKQSTLDLAKKLGITPEQYVREQLKLESRNG